MNSNEDRQWKLCWVCQKEAPLHRFSFDFCHQSNDDAGLSRLVLVVVVVPADYSRDYRNVVVDMTLFDRLFRVAVDLDAVGNSCWNWTRDVDQSAAVVAIAAMDRRNFDLAVVEMIDKSENYVVVDRSIFAMKVEIAVVAVVVVVDIDFVDNEDAEETVDTTIAFD